MQTRPIEITSADSIILEGQLDLPDSGGASVSQGVVICHPHSLYGGEMTNVVVMAIAAAVVQRGFAALRFNFRGVGRSTGAYGDGIGEVDDAAAALAWLSTAAAMNSGGAVSGNQVALAGYSFGGGVALAASTRRPDLAALALISPGINDGAADAYGGLTMPKLIATGEADNFATVERVRGLASRLPGATELYIAAQADHFWWGEEIGLGNRVADFIASAFTRAEG